MQVTNDSNDSAATVIKKLKTALDADGDFPVRAKVVADLRRLVNDPNTPIEKIVEVILSEPTLGTRLLHLVNSVMYQRRVPIVTISQAVVQLGMRALTDLCTGLVLLQKFSPTAARGGIFADNVKKSVLTSLLTSALSQTSAGGEEEERGYLAGTFFSIGPLLLAYYFPQVFESAEKRAKRRKQSTTQSITETIGISPIALSIGIIDSLSIPEYYRDLLTGAYVQYIEEAPSSEGRVFPPLSFELATAGKLADAIVDAQDAGELLNALQQVVKESRLTLEVLDAILLKIPQSFQQHCRMIEMSFLTLPPSLEAYVESKTNPNQLAAGIDAVGDDFGPYLDEIKEAIGNRETMSSIIASVMEAMVFGLKFDRAILLFSDAQNVTLQSKLTLGASFNINGGSFSRPISANDVDEHPESRAFFEGGVEVFGEPMFEDGWPFAAVPIGPPDKVIGIIYTDRIEKNNPDGQPLSDGTLLGLNMLADLLDRALAINSED